jgi:putative Mg2+ transporter-C (MgtC) family protein
VTVVGIACGAGQWPLVVICGLVSLLMLTVLGLIERRFFPDQDYTE